MVPVPKSVYSASNFKYLIILLIFSFFTYTPFNLTYAGEYHTVKEKKYVKTSEETLACSQCHTMHGSQGGYSMIYGQSGTPAGAVYPKLLRQATILQLCLYCHEGDNANLDAPNVWSGTAKFTNHSAGLLCADDMSNPPCPNNTANHTVDVNTTVTPPGWTGTTPLFTPDKGGFTCVSCHNPHGTTNFRNLRNDLYAGANANIDFTGVDVSYAMLGELSPQNFYVYNNVAPGKDITKYQTGYVLFRKAPPESPLNSAKDGLQAFCKACHTNFHFYGGESAVQMGGFLTGDTLAGATDTWLRHPTRDVTMDEANTNLHIDRNCWGNGTTANCGEAFDINSSGMTRVRYVDPDGAAPTTALADEQPFCLTCHRAHGSTNHSNLIFGEPETVGGTGTMMRQTCQQCHNQQVYLGE